MGQLLSFPVDCVHLESLTLNGRGAGGSMGPSNAGGQQACFLQERLWLMVLSREAKELRKCGQHETKCWLWIHCLQEQLE